jgi:hypothetical protein
VGIGDMSYIGQQVYQTKVDQKKYTIQTFEWPKEWYVTLWVYHGEAWYIGMYARFCTSAITDLSAYFVPVYTY